MKSRYSHSTTFARWLEPPFRHLFKSWLCLSGRGARVRLIVAAVEPQKITPARALASQVVVGAQAELCADRGFDRRQGAACRGRWMRRRESRRSALEAGAEGRGLAGGESGEAVEVRLAVRDCPSTLSRNQLARLDRVVDRALGAFAGAREAQLVEFAEHALELRDPYIARWVGAELHRTRVLVVVVVSAVVVLCGAAAALLGAVFIIVVTTAGAFTERPHRRDDLFGRGLMVEPQH